MDAKALKVMATFRGGRLAWSAAVPVCYLIASARRSFKWWIYAGYAAERASLTGLAARAYGRAHALARTANQRSAFRWLHVAEFLHERARHRIGEARVEDPLFECRVTWEGMQHGQMPGHFEVETVKAGLEVTGFAAADTGPVELRLDGQLLRTVTPSGNGRWRELRLLIKRPTVERFPRECQLKVQTKDGRLLGAFGRGTGANLQIPHGDGTITEYIGPGSGLDKKGEMATSPEAMRTRQAAYLRLYETARDFFDEQIGSPLFLMYGTLLGYYREGDFITGDDDFDVGYISEETDPVAVKAGAMALIEQLVAAGFSISFNRHGKLFRLHPRGNSAQESVFLDVSPIWFQGGTAWAHNDLSIPASIDDLAPVLSGKMQGTKVYIPRHTEVWLEGYYGSGWTVPDPSFGYSAAEANPGVSSILEKALITPDEYRALERRISALRDRNPNIGQFWSVGSESLYPLPATGGVPE